MLILIENSGTPSYPASGITKDIRDYKDFFQSDCGGAWGDDEITEYSNNDRLPLTSESLCRIIISLKRQEYEYFVIVFCGHGGMTEKGETFFEFSPNNNCMLSDLTKVFGDTKFMLIADSCRGIVKLKEGGVLFRNERFCNSGKAHCYRDLCREYYNQIIKEAPIGTYTICFSAGFDETAQDLGKSRGGLFSQNLLNTIPSICDDMEQQVADQGYDYMYASLSDCVKRANPMVKTESRDKQHPQCFCGNVDDVLPFIICPNWQLQLED